MEETAFERTGRKILVWIVYIILGIAALKVIGWVAEKITPDKYNDEYYEDLWIDHSKPGW